MTRPVIDVHTHLLPDLELLPGVEGIRVEDDGRLSIDGHRLGLPALYDGSELAAFVDRNGLDGAWVSPPPPTYRSGLNAAQTESWARLLHDGMLARIAGQASLRLLTYLPLDQPAVAHALARELDDDPIVGWTASAGGGSLPLGDSTFAPLWRVLEESGRPILLHPGESPDQRLQDHYMTNLLGNPVETAVAVGQLLLGGVLERYPGLRVVLVHCAGVVPVLVGRWARGVATERPGIREGTADPRRSVRSLWADTLAHSPAVVDLAVEVLGVDRLVLGSDYPFPMGVDDPRTTIAHLDRNLRDQIAQNAATLLPRRDR